MTDQQKDPAAHKRPRMAVPPDAPPGIEQDEKGNLIPFDKRTCDDQERARAGEKD
jgi:hypothetical protein